MDSKPVSLVDILFGSLTTVKYVPIPVELLNEPFAFEDNGRRPPIVTPTRQSFLFLIDAELEEVKCWVGGKKIVSHDFHKLYAGSTLPAKTATNISVVSVYDIYGLDVTCSFVRHLYSLTYKDIGIHYWIMTYFVGSLSVLRPGIEDVVDMHHKDALVSITSLLLLNLTQMDAAQPKLSHELVQHDGNLPVEVLARVLDNPTISKALYTATIFRRCIDPTLEDLEADNENSSTISLADGSYLLEWSAEGQDGEDVPYLIHIARDKSGYVLDVRERTQDDVFDLHNSKIVAFSVDNYLRWFNRRGCDQYTYTKRIYDRVRDSLKQVNNSNVDLACIWLV